MDLKDLADGAYALPGKIKSGISRLSGYDKFMNLADMASQSSREAFPGQEWDNTQRNAARHSIWTALMANQMGGGPIARGVARGVGYANEGIGLLNGDNLTRTGAIDMRHDLNNNAVGLNTLADLNKQGPATEQQIIAALLEKARRSMLVSAPSVFERDVGELTRGQ
jgi:hypothetical protein